MNVGGPAKLLVDFANELNGEEFEHILVTGRCEANEIDYLQSHQIKARVIYMNSVGRSPFLYRDIVSLFKMMVILRKIKPHIVHTHTSKAGLLGRVAALVAAPQAKRIHTFHGHLLYGYFSKRITKLLVFVEKVLAKISHVLIAVSHQIRQDLKALAVGVDRQWEVIHPGVSIQNQFSTEGEHFSLEIPRNKLVVSWVGRFTDIKDPKLAIEAFSQISPEILRNVVLIMAGDGELKDECERLAISISLPIIFLGWTNEIDVLLKSSNMLWMTSRNEGMPVVILEAAARGIPTLSTDVGGVRDFIVDGKNGVLTDRNRQNIATILSGIIQCPDQLNTLGANAKQLVVEEFSSLNYLNQHIFLYKRLLA
jgi:glycosyltransferase involved in cell wall biosynthesis